MGIMLKNWLRLNLRIRSMKGFLRNLRKLVRIMLGLEKSLFCSKSTYQFKKKRKFYGAR